MSNVEVLNQIKKLAGKFEKVQGIRVWGVDENGVPREVLVDSEGRLQTVSV
jgi:hypothetical protein